MVKKFTTYIESFYGIATLEITPHPLRKFMATLKAGGCSWNSFGNTPEEAEADVLKRARQGFDGESFRFIPRS